MARHFENQPLSGNGNGFSIKPEHLKPILFPAETLLEEATLAHSSGRWSFYLLCDEQLASPLPGFLKAH